MAFTKKTWTDRQAEYPGRRKLTATSTADVYDVTREEGLVVEEGDALNAANLNNLETRIEAGLNEKSDSSHTHSPEDLNTPVPLGKGGTGATTAVAARTALGAAATTTYTATLSTTWSGSGPYTQTVSISGILASDNPIVDLVPDADVARARLQIESWGFVGKVTTAANSITVTCYDDKPTITLPILLKVVR